MNYLISALSAEHRREVFSCGVAALDGWLKEQAGQSQKKFRTTVWVIVDKAAPEVILGYYSLAPYHLLFDDAPDELRRRLPPDPVYVILIARLAVSTAAQGQGLGRRLLADAANRALDAHERIPVQGVVVHAKDEAAAGFYQAFGFISFPTRPLQLFMTMKAIQQATK